MADDRRGGNSRPNRPGRPNPAQRSRTRPADRARRSDSPRTVAYRLLRAVAEGAYANLELPHLLRRGRIEGRDAAFATELAFGTIRWQGFYDACIAVAADRPVDRLDGGVLDVLRLGAHQLLGMRVPAHAAADQTVALARSVNGAGAAGLVNAVMRRLSERTREEWVATVTARIAEPVERLALEESHPLWVAKSLRQALLGHHASTAEQIDVDLAALLAADNDPPRVSLVARPGLVTVEELIAEGAEPGRLAPTAATLDRGMPGDLAAVRDGRAAVQDEGSQLVALAFAAATTDVPGRHRWLDLCAGPGGKAGLLAGLATTAGADLLANEVSEHRADLVRSSLRLGIEAGADHGVTVEVRTGDGRRIGEDEPQAYERVLVDAPCSGLGALRRRPEARWRRTAADLATLGPLQRDLLRSAIDATAPGGVIVYATCSPHLAETTFVVGDVTKRRDDVRVEDARPLFELAGGGAVTDLGPGPYVQLWPHVHGTDGMFFALLRKL